MDYWDLETPYVWRQRKMVGNHTAAEYFMKALFLLVSPESCEILICIMTSAILLGKFSSTPTQVCLLSGSNSSFFSVSESVSCSRTEVVSHSLLFH
ncbi:hypothetical protein CEXT_564751 [Caerostris extrusa]|uniref:Uncharacterized protein n=1 Tax=Caerostris extrusa TaxID=172846 RepID=A0AAV4WLI6_CAEEX|nr:hypothetical protein CEXT_564751 [Caerostris extrusa]